MSTHNFLISVILPNYNGSRFLKKSITSVLSQSYKNLELIIVDDSSTDSSVDIIRYYAKKDNRIRYVQLKKKLRGDGFARNLGIAKSKGDYIAFIDVDDFWYPNKLDYQINNIKNNNASFTAANYQIEGSLKKSNFLVNIIRIILQKYFLFKIKKDGIQWLFIYNPFILSSALIKKNFLKFTFNTSIYTHGAVDLRLWFELFNRFHNKFIFHSKILVTITRAKLSVSSNKIQEFNKIINVLSTVLFKYQKYKFFPFFIIGIFFRALKIILTNIYKVFRKLFYKLILLIFLFIFIVQYTPLFYFLGKKIIYNDPTQKTEAVVVITGQQGFAYFNNSYKDRYLDSLNYLKELNYPNDIKFYLYGKLQFIPDQKILESLLLNYPLKRENIYVIYEEYRSSYESAEIILEKLKKDNINSFTIITSPLHSYRMHKILSLKNNNNKIYFYDNSYNFKKNNFFEKALNKKEVIYEYLAIVFYRITKG